jgi:prepilin-type N-terminal cleavage/methylation domain-containing protein
MHRPVVRTPIVVSGCSPAHGRREFLSATGGSLSTARRTLRKAFTLIEVLVAMVVTLILMGIVVTIFGQISTGVSNSHATMDMTDQLRTAKNRLQVDLAGVTAQMLPPRRPEYGDGYFEIIDGPAGRLSPFYNISVSPNYLYGTSANTTFVLDEMGNSSTDSTVGDNDDILLFTTRSKDEPFSGRHHDPTAQWNIDTTIQSQVAEVAWFIRGTTLYRRQLLVRPDLNSVNGVNLVPQPTTLVGPPFYTTPTYLQPRSFYGMCDLSVRPTGAVSGALAFDLSPAPPSFSITANSLSDLTNRENRLFHRPMIVNYGAGGTPSNSPYGWPHDLRGWGVFYSSTPYGYQPTYLGSTMTTGRLGLPTLSECSSPFWFLPGTVDLTNPLAQQIVLGANATGGAPESFDAWDNPNPPWNATISPTGTPSTGVVDPLTGTLSFFPNPANNLVSSRLADDIMLTNVLSFDVRVWDPTAWTIALTDASGNTAAFAPGDPGYPQAVYNYVMQVPNFSYALVSQGAYVDLNYYASVVSFFAAKGPAVTSLPAPALQLLATGTQATTPVPALFPFTLSLNNPNYATALNFFLQYGVMPTLYGGGSTSTASTANSFFGPGDPRSRLDAFQRDISLAYLIGSNGLYIPAAAVYDTGSWNYEHDGIDQDGINFTNILGAQVVDSLGRTIIDQGTNGVDDNLDGVIDDPGELEAPPPYTAPLRGIQVKIRCFDPDSKQIREVTIIQEFVSE